MSLIFPNPNRSFDADTNRILFWGYDNIQEVSFYLETEALQKFNAEKTETESGLLMIFDSIRNQIYKAANNVYVRMGKSSACILSAKDF